MQPGDAKLLPRSPTDAMIQAGGLAINADDDVLSVTGEEARLAWQAMYDAAPALPPVEALGPAIVRLTELAEHHDIWAAYHDYPPPLTTMTADIRAVLSALAAPALPPVPEIEALVERLRFYAEDFPHVRCLHEAVAELTRLRAMCDELAGAVEQILWLRPAGDVEKCSAPRALVKQMEQIAGAAYAKYREEQGR